MAKDTGAFASLFNVLDQQRIQQERNAERQPLGATRNFVDSGCGGRGGDCGRALARSVVFFSFHFYYFSLSLFFFGIVRR